MCYWFDEALFLFFIEKLWRSRYSVEWVRVSISWIIDYGLIIRIAFRDERKHECFMCGKGVKRKMVNVLDVNNHIKQTSLLSLVYVKIRFTKSKIRFFCVYPNGCEKKTLAKRRNSFHISNWIITRNKINNLNNTKESILFKSRKTISLDIDTYNHRLYTEQVRTPSLCHFVFILRNVGIFSSIAKCDFILL